MLAVKTKPATFFHESVRNLSLSVSDPAKEDIEAVLSVCTGVENLSIVILNGQLRFMAPLAPLLTRLALKHLYIDARSIFRDLPGLASCFSGITHLELRGPPAGLPSRGNQRLPASHNDAGMWFALSLFPNLTHLSFNSAGFLPISLHLLGTCKALSVLVSLACTQEGGPDYKLCLRALSRDVRFVAMQCVLNLKDWQMGVYAGKDYWRCAEDFIAKRRAGVVDGTFPLFPFHFPVDTWKLR